MNDSQDLRYNDLEIDTIDTIFDKLHEARGGEMMLIHVSKYGKNGPTVRICSATNKKDSVLVKILPKLIENIND